MTSYTAHVGAWVLLLRTSAIITVCNFSFLIPRHKPLCKNWVWEEKQGMCMCAYVFAAYVCLYIFLYQLSLFPLYKALELDWFLFATGGRWHKATFQSALHFPVLFWGRAPVTMFLTPRHCPSQLFSQPSAQHHPVTSPLSKCVWLPTSLHGFVFSFQTGFSHSSTYAS